MEDVLMPNKNERQELVMSFEFPRRILNSRNDGLDQIVHIRGDKEDLLDSDFL